MLIVCCPLGDLFVTSWSQGGAVLTFKMGEEKEEEKGREKIRERKGEESRYPGLSPSSSKALGH